jgi:hypothetical protein
MSQQVDLLTVAAIDHARKAGATWAQIGSVLSGGESRDPKLAKKRAKAMARQAQRRLLAEGVAARGLRLAVRLR